MMGSKSCTLHCSCFCLLEVILGGGEFKIEKKKKKGAYSKVAIRNTQTLVNGNCFLLYLMYKLVVSFRVLHLNLHGIIVLLLLILVLR